MQDDLIDFVCADCWLDFYHERGLTPRHSSAYGQRRTKELSRLTDETVELKDQIVHLIATLTETMASKPQSQERPDVVYPSRRRAWQTKPATP